MMDKRVLIIVGFSAASFAVGTFAGHFFTKKNLEAYYEEQIDLEIAAALLLKEKGVINDFDDYPNAITVEREEKTRLSQELVKVEPFLKRADGSISYNKVPRTVSAPPASRAVSNPIVTGKKSLPEPSPPEVEEMQGVEEDYMPEDLELATLEAMRVENERLRDSGKPYVITQEECYEPSVYFETENLTYYSGDVVLADSRDEPVEIEETVGAENLEKFGYLSEPSIVCVLNPTLGKMYEIALDEGLFKVKVLGQKA